MRQLEYKVNSMCGKKSNMRQSADDEKRKQSLENSIFYYEYLNNTLNYILSGNNDLDHYLNYDQQVLKHIISTEPRDESVYFIERTKMMKTRCDPNLYLKDLQEYGQFTNYESSRTTMNEIRNIQRELQDEKEINLLIKRLKKRYKIQGELTVFEARRMEKQYKEDMLTNLCAQATGVKTVKSGYFESNKLYRQMFNISQSSLKEDNPDQTRAAKLSRSKLIKKPIKPAKQEYSPYIPKSKQSIKQEVNIVNKKIVEPIVQKQYIESLPSQVQSNLKANNIPASNIVSPPIVDKTIVQSNLKQPLFLPFQNQQVLEKLPNKQPQKKQNPIIPEKSLQKQQPKAPMAPVAAVIQQYHQPYFDGNSQTQAHQKKSTKQKKIAKSGESKKKNDDELKDKKEKIEKKRTYNKRPNAKHQIHPFSQMHHYPYRSPVIHMDQQMMSYPIPHPLVKESAEIGIQVDPNEDIQPLKVLTPRRPFTFSIITNPTNPTNPPSSNNQNNINPPISNNVVSNPAPQPPKISQNQQHPNQNSSMIAENQSIRIQNAQPSVQNLQQINPLLTDSLRFFNESRDFSISRPRADSVISQSRNNNEANGQKKDEIDIFLSFLDK